MSSLLLSSLLRRHAVLTTASLNHFHQRRDAEHRADYVAHARHVLYVPARYVLLRGCVHLRRRDPEVTFQVAKTQADLIFVSTQGQPPGLGDVSGVTEERCQAIYGYKPPTDASYS